MALQEVEAAKFIDNLHMKVVRLSALRTGHLHSQEIYLVFTPIRCRVDPRSIVRPEGLSPQNPDDTIGLCSAVSQPAAPQLLTFQAYRSRDAPTL